MDLKLIAQSPTPKTFQANPVVARLPAPCLRPLPSLGLEIGRWGAGLALAASLIFHSPEALADEVPAGPEQVFANTCAGCHSGGGNIVRRDATLKLEDLQKYGIDSLDGLYNIIYSGKGSMPGYGEGCTPKGACTFGKRLSDEQVEDLAGYVLSQAKAGWQ